MSLCAICDLLELKEPSRNPDGSFTCECNCCGKYTFSAGWATTPALLKGKNAYLSAATKQASDVGRPLTLTHANWEAFADQHADVAVSRKIEALLQVLARKTKQGKYWEEMGQYDYLLVDAADSNELGFLIDSLEAEKYVEQGLASKTRSDLPPHMQPKFPRLTVAGWVKVNSTGEGSGIPGRCFVAMAFRS